MHNNTVHIVESTDELNELLAVLAIEDVYIHAVCSDMDKHVSNNNISLLFFYFTKSDEYWCLPIMHNEAICIPTAMDILKGGLKKSKTRYKIVSDKKSIVQLFGEDMGFIDADVINFLEEGKTPDDIQLTNAYQFVKNNFRTTTELNLSVPIYKHAKTFMAMAEKIKNLNTSSVNDKGFLFTNNTMSNLFAKLEANGLCVNDNFTDVFGEEQNKHIKGNLVYSQYNLLTSTGRPSNRFAGVNYAALNKNDGSRNCFVSRYGNDGMLVMMDYTAFHPRLIALLSGFDMPLSENPYSYLAKYYFKKDEISDDDISLAKGFTFTQIYGGIDNRWLHIPYFRKVQDYIDHRWKFFEKNGYIETPKYGRRIKHCHIENPSPNKLFNYILQAFETETAVDVLGELTDYLKNSLTKPVLYTYDSILFDAHRSDKMPIINNIKRIMEQNKFPVKVYVGKNYGDMKQITL